MVLDSLRIGYVPCSGRLTEPGDRRRFCYYAKKRNVKFEIAKPSERYDLVVVTERADLSVWCKYSKGDAKIVYDLIDSYLAIPRTDPKGIFRGLAKFVTRQSRFLQIDYWKAVEAMCGRSDAVVCTTEEQREDILKFCPNVHIILDIHTNDVRAVKTNYSAGRVFNFVWEGLPENLQTFNSIRPMLDHLNQMNQRFAFHIVTNLQYGQFLGRYYKRHTIDVVRRMFGHAYLYEWNDQLCSSIIAACDMALIPIPLDDRLYRGKPENKLLLFWRMGVPVVVSATPAYERAMEQCGVPMACRSDQEWDSTLERYVNDESARREAGQRGREFAEAYHGEGKTLARWDALFESLPGIRG